MAIQALQRQSGGSKIKPYKFQYRNEIHATKNQNLEYKQNRPRKILEAIHRCFKRNIFSREKPRVDLSSVISWLPKRFAFCWDTDPNTCTNSEIIGPLIFFILIVIDCILDVFDPVWQARIGNCFSWEKKRKKEKKRIGNQFFPCYIQTLKFPLKF